MSEVSGQLWSEAVEDILKAGRRMDQRGWVPATAGNLSRRLSDGRIAITRSGGHKGFLVAQDVIEVDPQGRPCDAGQRSSAETLLHTQLYAFDPRIRAVLHGHSVAATVLSMTHKQPALQLEGYELLKVFEAQTTHDATLSVPFFDNDQNIARLASVVAPSLDRKLAGYVIRGHGVYVWGDDMAMALARLEGLEFLLACELERRSR